MPFYLALLRGFDGTKGEDAAVLAGPPARFKARSFEQTLDVMRFGLMPNAWGARKESLLEAIFEDSPQTESD